MGTTFCDPELASMNMRRIMPEAFWVDSRMTMPYIGMLGISASTDLFNELTQLFNSEFLGLILCKISLLPPLNAIMDLCKDI